jgi:hypothetical protein
LIPEIKLGSPRTTLAYRDRLLESQVELDHRYTLIPGCATGYVADPAEDSDPTDTNTKTNTAIRTATTTTRSARMYIWLFIVTTVSDRRGGH